MKLGSVIFQNFVLAIFPLPMIRDSIMLENPVSNNIYDVDVVHHQVDWDDNVEDVFYISSTHLQANYFRKKSLLNESIDTVMVFYHAGSFLMGHPNQLTGFINAFLNETDDEKRNILVAAVEVRQSPEISVNRIYNDAWEMLQLSVEYVGGGLEGKRLVLAGESSGGRLAILMSQWIRDDGYKLIERKNLQVTVFYPHLCYWEEKICEDLNSHTEYEHGAVTSRKYDELIQSKLYFDDYHQASRDPDFFSVFKDMKNLPSTYILHGELDYHKSEGKLYIDLLNKHSSSSEEGITGVFEQLDNELHMFLDVEFLLDQNNLKNVARKLVDVID